MRLKCLDCNFELNLSIKTLPKNTKLYCPKCKSILSPLEQETASISVESTNKSTIGTSQSEAPVPAPSTITDSSQRPERPQNINPPVISTKTQSQLFNEDLKPEFDLLQSEEEIHKKREELFSKPEQVWYDSTEKPAPITSIQNQNIAPPPIPSIPPPIPANAPPPIPMTSQTPQSGYISASSSIQIDSSLVMPDKVSSSPPLPSVPPLPEEKIELATETTTPLSDSISTNQEGVLDNKISDISNRTDNDDKKDVIILSPQTFTPKKISITIPAISLIVLACIAGFIYYQIVVSSSKSDLIKDLKSTPALGTIPALQKGETQGKETDSDDKQANMNSTKKSVSNSKTTVKAKRSALEHYKKGNQYFMESKYEQARDEYAMAIAADPNFGLAYRGLGTTYAKLGLPDLAVKNYEKYIEIMPNATDAEQVKNIIKQYYGK